jgi:hypothetical protein
MHRTELLTSRSPPEIEGSRHQGKEAPSLDDPPMHKERPRGFSLSQLDSVEVVPSQEIQSSGSDPALADRAVRSPTMI